MTTRSQVSDEGTNTATAIHFLITEETMTAYCLKCREKREITNAEAVTLKNGRPAMRGDCPVCGIKVFRIGRAEAT